MDFSREDLQEYNPLKTTADFRKWMDLIKKDEAEHPYNNYAIQPKGIKYQTFTYFGRRCVIGLN